jgi:hypothetical protein
MIRDAEQSSSFTIRLVTNDPKRPEAMIAVRARARSLDYSVTPRKIDFGPIPIGASCRKSARISRRADARTRDLKSLRIECQSPWIGAAVMERVEGPLGPFRYKMSGRRGDGAPVLEATGEGLVLPRLSVSPAHLILATEGMAQSHCTRLIMIRNCTGESLGRIIRIDAPPGATVAATSGVDEDKSRRRLRVSADLRDLAKNLGAKELRIWFEGEPDPLAIQLVCERSTNTHP